MLSVFELFVRTCAFQDFDLFVITAILYFRYPNIESVFENRVLRKAIGPKGEEVTGQNYTLKSYIICSF